MSGIWYSNLSDDEFERMVYMAIGSAGALPAEIAKELALRNTQAPRNRKRPDENPRQLTPPIDS